MNYQQLKDAVNRDQSRQKKAQQERSTLMQATRILGVFGLMLVLPIVGGAYLGLWLDGFADDYSVRWTVGFILLGVMLGGFNAWLSLRE